MTMLRPPGRSRRPPRTVTVLTCSSLIQAAGYAATAMLSSALLGADGRGLMVLGVSIASLVALLVGLGTGAQLRARLPSADDPALRRRVLGAYTWASLGAVLLACTLAAGISAGSARLIDPAMAAPGYLVAIVVVSMAYTGLTQLPDLWYATGSFRAGTVWASAVVCGGLLGMSAATRVDLSADALLLGQGTGMLVVCLAQVARMRRAGLLPFARPADELPRLFRFGSRAMGLTVGLTVALRADRYVLGAFVDTAAIGVYSLAATLAEVPRLVPIALGQLVNRQAALGHGVDRVRRASRMALVAAVAAALLIGGAGWLTIEPVFGPSFAAAVPLLGLMLVAEVAFTPFTITSRALLGAGRMTAAGALGIGGGLSALTAYLILIPLWGTVGAAVASLTVYTGLSVAGSVLVRRLLGESVPEASAAPADQRPRTYA
ncbi:lipopolysaccharide biosynthesis protein [Micromonospora sp. RP3T]|uniref:lipopolysaccharide biosynthesis protein n=1 Tax=Micromonospora sp. RP3T TaxID=2135446 RepID=UPI0011B2996B|nr:lipopolysaccharide biosynthesis protein [Micromonospora sp. RP3T]